MLQINTGSLYQVLKDFYTLTKIRIVLFDGEFREVLSYPEGRLGFCGVLRQDPSAERRCAVSDKAGCQRCAKSQKLEIYRCHAGLIEAVVPVLDRDGVIAYVMFGQILPQEGEQVLRSQLRGQYPMLTQEIDAIAAKGADELNAAATVLQAITSYVMSNRWVMPGKSEFIRRLDEYVERNLRQSITVEDLTEEFHMSRTRLYDAAAAYLGCGLAEYIRRRRIFHARQMLRETQLPVAVVAEMVGFPDYNYFSRVFRQVTGMPARRYRQSAT